MLLSTPYRKGKSMKTVLSNLPDSAVDEFITHSEGKFRLSNEHEPLKLVNVIAESTSPFVVVTTYRGLVGGQMGFPFASIMEAAQESKNLIAILVIGVSSYEEADHVKSFAKSTFKHYCYQADQIEGAALRLIELL